MRYDEYRKGNGGGGAIRRRDPAEIERDVREIRAEMSDTLRRIEDRFSPRELLHHMSGGARTFGSGSATMAKNLGATVRDNPVPLLLIGAGIASLMWSQRREPSVPDAFEPAHRPLAVSSLRSRAAHVRERAGEMRGRVADAGHRARDVAHEARMRGRNIVDEQPLVLVGVGLAAGALLAALLPMTDREHRTAGRARDRLVDRAREVARGAREGMEPGSVAVQPTVRVRGSTPPEEPGF